MLLDTSVDVTDSSGVTRPAPLFFIQPTQINLQIPLGTALGPADVRVNRASGVPFLGSFEVERVAPGIFSADGSGRGVAAAAFQRTEAEGPDTIDLVFDRTTRRFVPIDLGSGDQQVFLLLFGTGIRVTANVDEYPKELRHYRDHLEGRSMLVKKLDMVPIECVARGYLAGSGWKEYQGEEFSEAWGNLSYLSHPRGQAQTKEVRGDVGSPIVRRESDLPSLEEPGRICADSAQTTGHLKGHTVETGH